MITAKHIMSPDPIALYESHSLNQIIETFKSYPYDHIPIIDIEKNLKGIISKSDMFNNLRELSQATSGNHFTQFTLNYTLAGEIMTEQPVYVKSTQSLPYLMEILLQGQFHAVPVTEDGKLVGIITAKDILMYLSDNNLIEQNS